MPDVLATPGAAPAALPMAGMEPDTEFRPGRLLLACIGPLAWIMSLPVVDEDEDEDEVPHDAPMTLAAAATPDTGRDRPQRTRWPS